MERLRHRHQLAQGESLNQSTKPLSVKVQEWLEKQGYPLEMTVASKLARVDLDVTQSSYYDDPETGDPREIDVVAEFALPSDTRSIIFRLLFPIECKKSSSPWVAFRTTTFNEPNLYDFGWLWNCSGGFIKRQLREDHSFAVAGPNYHSANLATGLSVANLSKPGQQQEGDAAYKALLSSC